MTDTTPDQAAAAPAAPPRRSRLPLIAALALAPLLGGGAYFAMASGLVPLAGPSPAGSAHLPDSRFVAVPPMVVSLGPAARHDHLRFGAQLDVPAAMVSEVEAALPRVVDILNGYLRAVDPAELEEPAALPRLRAQMLRRIQVVTGEGRVNDLLISEFVLN